MYKIIRLKIIKKRKRNTPKKETATTINKENPRSARCASLEVCVCLKGFFLRYRSGGQSGPNGHCAAANTGRFAAVRRIARQLLRIVVLVVVLIVVVVVRRRRRRRILVVASFIVIVEELIVVGCLFGALWVVFENGAPRQRRFRYDGNSLVVLWLLRTICDDAGSRF